MSNERASDSVGMHADMSSAHQVHMAMDITGLLLSLHTAHCTNLFHGVPMEKLGCPSSIMTVARHAKIFHPVLLAKLTSMDHPGIRQCSPGSFSYCEAEELRATQCDVLTVGWEHGTSSR